MRKKNIFPLVAIFMGATLFPPGIDSLAAKPVAFDTLRHELTAQKELGTSRQVQYEVPSQAYLFAVTSKPKPVSFAATAPTGTASSALVVVSDLAIPPLYDPVAEEAAARKVAEEAARKAAAETAAQKAAEEVARKAAVETAARKAAEEAARKAAAEAGAQKAAEETARKAAAEAAAQKAAEETARKAAAEAAAQKAAEEAARKAAVEAVAQKVAREAAQKAAREASAPRPAVKPATRNPPGRSHVSNVQGQAAAADFSRHNVYEFELSGIGNVSTLTFWATGRRNFDSYGKIWVVSPDGRREKVGIWEVSNVSTIGATSYKDMPAIKYDISKLVTRPGIYKVEFDWTGGDGPLYIYRVELTS